MKGETKCKLDNDERENKKGEDGRRLNKEEEETNVEEGSCRTADGKDSKED